MYAPHDGRGDVRNMLSHTQTSSNRLVKLLHLVGWIIRIVLKCIFNHISQLHFSARPSGAIFRLNFFFKKVIYTIDNAY